MTTTSSSQSRPDDKESVIAALNLLGVEVRTQTHGDDGAVVEVFAARVAQPGDAKESGFKFTFTHGRLTGLHARAWADHDRWWAVSESPSYARATSAPVFKAH